MQRLASYTTGPRSVFRSAATGQTLGERAVAGGPVRAAAEKGLNRFVWDLRYPDATRFPGMILWSGNTSGPQAAPGSYQVKLTVDGKTMAETFEVRKDPRVSTTQEEFQKQFDLLTKIRDKFSETSEAIIAIRDVRKQAQDYAARVKDQPNAQPIIDAAKALGDKGRTSIALTAAGIATLNAAGRYDDAAIQDGIEAIWRELTLRGQSPDFPEYERLYLAQAFWQLSDTSHFRRWFADERDDLLRTQAADGSWKGSRFGPAYATAVNCLVLSLPDAALPIFQR